MTGRLASICTANPAAALNRAAEQANIDFSHGALSVTVGRKLLSLGRGGAVNVDVALPSHSRLSVAVASADLHVDGAAGHQRRPVHAAILVEGFDIPLDDPAFSAAVRRVAPPVVDRGVPVVTAATNVRAIDDDWQAYHGFALASMLTFAGGAQGAGLVASTDTYARPVIGWGSNAITDPLLGSDAFAIVHDGCGAHRVAKVAALAAWPDLLAALRFCWMGPRFDRNCGRCLKCVTMAMILRVLDLPTTCFDVDPSDDVICSVLRGAETHGFTATYNQPILDLAVERDLREPWVPVLRNRLRRARLGPALDTLVDPVRRRVPPLRLPAGGGS